MGSLHIRDAVTQRTQPKWNGASKGRALPLIYLVDDEPMVLDLAELILRPLGYPIQKFQESRLALESFRKANPKPAALVTDYAMPGMNGLALMDECRKIEPGLKVLLMSGTVSEEICRGRKDAPDKFVAKPFDVGQFAVEVARLIS